MLDVPAERSQLSDGETSGFALCSNIYAMPNLAHVPAVSSGGKLLIAAVHALQTDKSDPLSLALHCKTSRSKEEETNRRKQRKKRTERQVHQ